MLQLPAALLSASLLLGSHVVIVMDDVGLSGVRAYADQVPAGIEMPATPVLDSIAEQGIRFTRAHVNPICGPTRAGLFTGRYGFHNGTGSNLFAGSAGAAGASELWLPEALDATHGSALVGKWHLATLENGLLTSPLHPAQGGVAHFDFHRGPYANLVAPDEDFFNWFKLANGVFQRVGNPITGPFTRTPEDYNTSVLVDDAIGFIQSQPGDFLLVLSFSAGHRPYHKPPTKAERAAVGKGPLMTARTEKVITAFEQGDAGLLKRMGWNDVGALQPGFLAAYLGMVEAMDTEIGRLVSESGIDLDPVTGDTTLWILGDNGPEFLIVQEPLEASHAKGSQYQLSTQVPFLVCGRGVTQGGLDCGRLVQHVDVFATILAMEGVVPPPGVDGVDLRPLFADVVAPPVREFAYTEAFLPTGPIPDPTSPSVTSWDRAIQDEQWKLITLMPQGPVGPTTRQLFRVGEGVPTWTSISLPNAPPGLEGGTFGLAKGDPHETFDYLDPENAVPGARGTMPEHLVALQRLLELEADLLAPAPSAP